MPVETPNLRVTFAHELTHSVHMQLAGVKNGFGAPIGETMFLEGLAMQTSRRAPGLPNTDYVAMAGDKDWIAHCRRQKDLILKGISPDLDGSGRDIAMKYTLSQGNTGMQRRALLRGVGRDEQAHRVRQDAARTRTHSRRQDGRYDPRGDGALEKENSPRRMPQLL